MSDPVAQATACYERYREAFNTRNVSGMVAEMHFPHRRLSGKNKFEVWETADEYRVSRGEAMTASLSAEGWSQTATTSIEAVQSGHEKVHLALGHSRQRADGTEYNAFATLWIITKIAGRWGIQFRSSFLSETA
jgi:hypothetical protein